MIVEPAGRNRISHNLRPTILAGLLLLCNACGPTGSPADAPAKPDENAVPEDNPTSMTAQNGMATGAAMAEDSPLPTSTPAGRPTC